MIKLINLQKSYGNKMVLKSVNLEVKRGEFISIVGESGTGKSTLLNIIGLLETFDSGDYYFKDQRINPKKIVSLNQFRLHHIGFVFQMFYLLPKLTVKDNILLSTLYGSKPIDYNLRLENLVKMLKIDDLLEEKAEYLSGGEKQRVAIARALLNNPDVLICDEPTGNLDVKNTDIVFDILKAINREGTTVIIVTHDLNLAKKTDKVYHLSEGVLHEAI